MTINSKSCKSSVKSYITRHPLCEELCEGKCGGDGTAIQVAALKTPKQFCSFILADFVEACNLYFQPWILFSSRNRD